jgi:hypothetical protein
MQGFGFSKFNTFHHLIQGVLMFLHCRLSVTENNKKSRTKSPRRKGCPYGKYPDNRKPGYILPPQKKLKHQVPIKASLVGRMSTGGVARDQLGL